MDSIYNIDFAILDALQKIHNPVLNVILAFFTYIGEGGIVWIAFALVLLFFKDKQKKKISAAVLLSLILEVIFNEKIIKHIVKRPRPFTLHPNIDTIVHRPGSFSFPSGHSCCAFAAATAVFMFDKRLGIFCYITAALIAFSRNYFYIHYPTDVLCGAVLGVILGIISAVIIKAVMNSREKKLADSTNEN